MMKWHCLVLAAVCWVLSLLHQEANAQAGGDLTPRLQAQLAKTPVPGQGLVAALLQIDAATGNTSLLATGAAGPRLVGSSSLMLPDDPMMVASCGKSHTASVFGVLVTQGLVDWTDTIQTILTRANVAIDGITPQFANSTVQEVLAHRAGFPRDTNFNAAPESIVSQLKPETSQLTPTQQRALMSRYILTRPADTRRGVFSYSNDGYNIAAWLSELVSGQAWETMIQNYIYTPLGMKTGGFTLPYTYPIQTANIATPIGQLCLDDGPLSTWPYEWIAYTPSMLGSGGLYMSVPDLALWVSAHIRGSLGLPQPLNISQAAFQALHKPWGGSDTGDYALGWTETNSTLTRYMEHDGSFAGFRAYMLGTLTPDATGKLYAFASSTNIAEVSDAGRCATAIYNTLYGLAGDVISTYYRRGPANGTTTIRRSSSRRLRRLLHRSGPHTEPVSHT